MKKLLIIFIVFSSLSVSGQTSVYKPFPDSNAVWNQYFESSCTGLAIFIEENEFFLSGDTSLNGLIYHKFYTNHLYEKANCFGGAIYRSDPPVFNLRVGAIREDTTKKVFYFDYYDSQEYLVYDFNLNIGDIIPISYIHNDTSQKIFISSIDSICDGSNYRKRFLLSDSIGNYCYFNYCSIIEGIGSMWGLLEEIDIIPFHQLKQLRCLIQDGTIKYQDSIQIWYSSNSACSLLPVEDIKTNNEISIYPNPFNISTTIRLGPIF